VTKRCHVKIPDGGRGRYKTFIGKSCRNRAWRNGYCKTCYEHHVSQVLADYEEMYDAFKYALENDIEPFKLKWET